MLFQQGLRVDHKGDAAVAFHGCAAQPGQQVEGEPDRFDKGVSLAEEAIYLQADPLAANFGEDRPGGVAGLSLRQVERLSQRIQTELFFIDDETAYAGRKSLSLKLADQGSSVLV